MVKDDKYYWLEHAWEKYRGIHECKTLIELLQDIKDKFKNSILKQNINERDINIYEYENPNYGATPQEFMNYCEHEKKLII